MVELAVIDVIKRGHLRLKHYTKEVLAEALEVEAEHKDVINHLVGEAVDQVLLDRVMEEHGIDVVSAHVGGARVSGGSGGDSGATATAAAAAAEDPAVSLRAAMAGEEATSSSSLNGLSPALR